MEKKKYLLSLPLAVTLIIFLIFHPTDLVYGSTSSLNVPDGAFVFATQDTKTGSDTVGYIDPKTGAEHILNHGYIPFDWSNDFIDKYNSYNPNGIVNPDERVKVTDTYKGMSGSPVFNSSYQVVGIHTLSNPMPNQGNFNGGIRITNSVINWINTR